MNGLRIFGNNIHHLLSRSSREDFCQELGYSNNELNRLEEGRLILNTDSIDKIAKYFHTTREYLFSAHGEYTLISCIGLFDKDDLSEVLDLFDNYCDLAEVVEN